MASSEGGQLRLMIIATPSVRGVSSTANWRHQRLGHWDVINNMLRRGLLPSPLMSAPWVKASIFRRDWLHAADQGVAADFGGNLCRLLVTKMVGPNVSARTQTLFEELQACYDADDVPMDPRLSTCTPTMIQQSRKNRS